MEYKTIRLMICILIILSVSSLVLADQQIDVFVTTQGSCFNNSQIIVSVLDLNNMILWQENATLQGSFPTQNIYRATLGPLPASVNINVSAVAYGNAPCLAYGTATATDITSAQINPVPLPLTVLLDINMAYDFNIIAPLNNTIQDNDTYFEWNLTFEHTPLFNLVVDNNSDFSSPEVNRTNITTTSYTLNTSEQLKDGQYYWHINVFNQSNNVFIQRSDNLTFNVSDGSIQIYNIQPDSSQWFNTSSTLMSFMTTGNASCRYGTVAGDNYSQMTQMSTTGGMSHSTTIPLSTEGGNNIYIMCNSTLGFLTPEQLHTVNRDTVNPLPGTVTINDGDQYTLNSTINVSWTNFTDALSGISGYFYGYSLATRVFTNSTNVTMTNAEEGGERVYVWPIDRAGNVGEYARDGITVDMLAPDISLYSITNLNKYTTTDLTLIVNVLESSPLQGSVPSIRYQKWNNSMSSWLNMTTVAATRFSYVIPQAPDIWNDHLNESVYIEIYATDIHGRSSTFNITELVNDVTTPPIVNPIGSYSVYQDEAVTFNITIFDPDNDNIMFSLNHSTATLTKYNNSIATFSWTPTAADIGTNLMTISVDDGIYVINETFSIIVINVNDPPTFDANNDNDFTAYVYTTFNATFNVTDADNDNLTFSTNSSIFLISQTGEIRAFPTDEARGIHHVNVTVEDTHGGKNSLLITIDVKFCGDNDCSDHFESCSLCARDCGTCGDSESAAIIIYPRNCLEESMTIKAVRLVERATCDTQGLIVDGLEVCGNLSDQEIYLERIINDTYEEVSTLITDGYGIVTFIPVESGKYRLTLKNYDIETLFTSKQCIDDDLSGSTVPATVATKTGTVSKQVERPEEINIPDEERPAIVFWLLFVIIPGLMVLLVIVLAKFFYDLQVRRMKQGKLRNSKYVAMIDKYILSNWYRLRKWFIDKTLSNDTIVIIIKNIEDFWGKLFKKSKSNGASIFTKMKAAGIIPKPRPKLYDIKYFDVPNLTDSRLKELVAISIARFMVEGVKTKTIIKTIIDCLAGVKHTEMADIAYALTASGLKVEYRDTTNYKKGDPTVEKIKSAMKHGTKFKKMRYSFDDIKRLMKSKAAAIVEIIAKDKNGNFKPMIFPVVGHDKTNIIVHDYYTNTKERKINAEIFEKAWKNARFKVVIVEK